MNFEKKYRKDREEQCDCGKSYESPFCCGETQETIFNCGFAEEIPEGNPISDILEMLFPNPFGIISAGDLVENGKTWERFKAFEEIAHTLREVIVEDKDTNVVQYNVEKDISSGSTIIKIEVR